MPAVLVFHDSKQGCAVFPDAGFVLEDRCVQVVCGLESVEADGGQTAGAPLFAPPASAWWHPFTSCPFHMPLGFCLLGYRFLKHIFNIVTFV